MTVFLNNVLSLLNQKGISRNKMLTDLNLGKNSFVNWENRGTVPGGNTLYKIADYFNVTTDYLLGSEQINNQCDEMDLAVMQEMKKLTETQKKTVLKYIRHLLSEDNNV